MARHWKWDGGTGDTTVDSHQTTANGITLDYRLSTVRRSVQSQIVMLRLPSFRYEQPKTLHQALRMKEDAGLDAMYVAGGTDLYPNMKRRHQQPKVEISLAGVRALKRITGGTKGSPLSVCAGVTLTELHSHRKVVKAYGALAKAAELVSTPLLRNMGTFGGNLCLDTRCTYYNQTYEWRKSIDFCLK